MSLTLRKINKGLTLLETVIAIGILSLVILAVLSIYTYVFRMNRQLENRQQAHMILEQIMEIKLNQVKVYLAGGAGRHVTDAAINLTTSAYVSYMTGISYQIDDEVLSDNGTPLALKRITLSLQYKGEKGETRYEKATTFLGE